MAGAAQDRRGRSADVNYNTHEETKSLAGAPDLNASLADQNSVSKFEGAISRLVSI